MKSHSPSCCSLLLLPTICPSSFLLPLLLQLPAEKSNKPLSCSGHCCQAGCCLRHHDNVWMVGWWHGMPTTTTQHTTQCMVPTWWPLLQCGDPLKDMLQKLSFVRRVVQWSLWSLLVWLLIHSAHAETTPTTYGDLLRGICVNDKSNYSTVMVMHNVQDSLRIL